MLKIDHAFEKEFLPPAQRKIILPVIQSALDAVDPYDCVNRAIRKTTGGMFIGNDREEYSDAGKIAVISIGKASIPMARAVNDLLQDHVTRTLCICKHFPEEMPEWKNSVILQGGHPIPDQKSIKAGKEIRNFLRQTCIDEMILCLISGGGSALVADLPDGIGLSDFQELTRLLLYRGASIQEINVLRKHLDGLKGGKLASLVPRNRIVSLILSDVIGNPLDSIASGITVQDPSTFSDAWQILSRYQLEEKIPLSIRDYLQSGLMGDQKENPKPGESSWNVQNILVGSNETAAQAAMETAQRLGIKCQIVTNQLSGEAREVGSFLTQLINQEKDEGNEALWIAGGETTVIVKGNGKGGRNLEVALGAVRGMAGKKNCVLITLATDGEDGTTGAAGAIVTEETLNKAISMGMVPEKYLEMNDSFTFFKKLDQLIITGPTGTNVNDLNFLFQF